MFTSLVLVGLIATAEVGVPTAEPLSFREFFEPGSRRLKPSPRLLGLSGQRIRMVGYGAQMEMRPGSRSTRSSARYSSRSLG